MVGKRAICIMLLALGVLLQSHTPGKAASRGEINAGVNATLERFYWQVPGSQALVARAAGVLVFPTVIKAGFGIGGEYGEGAMRVGGRTVGYYNVISGSVGFPFGAPARAVLIIFMTPQAPANFQRGGGFRVCVDESGVVVGAGGSIDTDKITSPVIGFVLDSTGLMYNLTLEGSKITRIYR